MTEMHNQVNHDNGYNHILSTVNNTEQNNGCIVTPQDSIFGWDSSTLVFDLVYGNILTECLIINTFGISVEDVLLHIVAKNEVNSTEAEIRSSLIKKFIRKDIYNYFVSSSGTHTLFDTLISRTVLLRYLVDPREYSDCDPDTQLQYISTNIMDLIHEMFCDGINANRKQDLRNYSER